MDSNAKVRAAWDANARFWDEQMGEGNDFVNLVIWPAVERLLAPRLGQRLLDVACGKGLTSRRLAAMGASVVAVDFSEALIEIARAKGDSVDYRMVDVTDFEALIALGAGRFDGALCNMAFMDIADLQPLMRANAAELLRTRVIVWPCAASSLHSSC